MTMFQPDPEWFKGPYAPLWKQHKAKVDALREELIKRFPSLKESIRVGLGADSEELIKIPPYQKDEPDLDIYHQYKLLCHIEVSGSDKVRVPPSDVWIRPGKITLGAERERKGEPYWFYMVYPNNIVVLRASDAEAFISDRVNVSPYGKREVYCEIPCTATDPKETLFKWIKEQRIKEA